MDARGHTKGGLGPARSVPRPSVSGSSHRPHTRGDSGQQFERRLPVLLADRVAVGGQPERGEHLVTQVAQPSPLAAIGGGGAGAGESGRSENAASTHVSSRVETCTRMPDTRSSWSGPCQGRVRAIALAAVIGRTPQSRAWPTSRFVGKGAQPRPVPPFPRDEHATDDLLFRTTRDLDGRTAPASGDPGRLHDERRRRAQPCRAVRGRRG